ncbi:winged helix DNA-binding domain-containing protein [Streptomyces sp. E11-3]|uniref:winged helix DNA-binding domain-containing protein n=1 Tax=Streptomyces sp. E11-3 TaxID=3110112 RepID=UPI003980D929
MLDRRALNRATLARQLLLQRHDMTASEAIGHLIGLQSQLPNPPYIGLWTRLRDFAIDDLTRLMNERTVVRCLLMRGTLHLVTAEDLIRLRPVVQPALDRSQRGFFRRDTEGMDLAELASFVSGVLGETPTNNVQLRKLLAERWPDRKSSALLHSTQFLVPMVYVPPGGTWGKGGSVPMTTVESWLGRSVGADGSPRDMILRYLAAFGPASVKDVQAWSGLTRLKQHIEELRPRLYCDRDENGVELFDLPDAPRPDPDTPAPVRFLPEYDNLLVAHADRTRVISDAHRKLTNSNNGMVAATILVDGEVRGRWRLERARRAATLAVEPFGPLAEGDQRALAEEGGRLLGFAAADAETHDIRFDEPR